MTATIITKTPQCKKVREYISYYYFHQSNSGKTSFIYYPHYKKALTIYKNSSISFKKPCSVVKQNMGIDYCIAYSHNVSHPIHADILGPFTKVGIVFQPLGINRFFNETIDTFYSDSIEIDFQPFANNKEFHLCLNKIFDAADIDKKVEILDSYFSNHQKKFELGIIEKAVSLIVESNKKISVSDLSFSLNISRKTLTRHFKKHLCCNPKEYIDIVFFRKAINIRLDEMKKHNLSEIAYSNGYYDQSALIEHFRKLTNMSPTEFFKSTRKVKNLETYWKFIK